MTTDGLETAGSQDVLELVLNVDEQVTLTGDLEQDAKAVWLHLHKKLLSAEVLTVNGAGNRVFVRWVVNNAKG